MSMEKELEKILIFRKIPGESPGLTRGQGRTADYGGISGGHMVHGDRDTGAF